MRTTKYQYKVRTQLGFTGVSLYSEQGCLDTISQYTNCVIERANATKFAKQLNQALDKGREEVLVNIAFFMAEQKKSKKLKLISYLEKQYSDILKQK